MPSAGLVAVPNQCATVRSVGSGVAPPIVVVVGLSAESGTCIGAVEAPALPAADSSGTAMSTPAAAASVARRNLRMRSPSQEVDRDRYLLALNVAMYA